MNIKQKILAIEKQISSLQYQSKKEEIANFLTHGAGALLSVAALAVLVVFASMQGNFWQIVSFSVFGSALVFLYFSSAFFHFFQSRKGKNFFRIFDYIGIFLLIAGTYTPILLVYLRNGWGWSLLVVVWFLALAGILLRIFFQSKVELVLAVLYVLMGWSILIVAKPALETIPSGVLVWLLIGGASYMIGLVFLSWKNLPFHHAIWHLFVLCGSTAHFFGMILNI